MEKDLLQKLNNLKEIKPSKDWKEKNRQVLVSQISAFQKAKEIKIQEEIPVKRGFFSIINQPAWAVFCIVLIIIGGGFSAQAAKNIKPGNSMYIARIMSEKAQVAMTFNKEKRVRLDMKFAQNRAREITEVLADPAFDYETDSEKAAKLAKNFRKDLNTIKEKIGEISKIKEIDDPIVALGGRFEEGVVRTVDAGKGGGSLDFYDPNTAEREEDVEEIEKVEEVLPLIEEIIVTSTKEIGATSSEDIFEKAEEALLDKNFEETKSILEQVDEIIERMEEEDNQGEVLGEEEEIDTNTVNSTTTENN